MTGDAIGPIGAALPGPTRATELPDGTVTLLVTDVEGAADLAETLGRRYPEVMAQHVALLRSAIRPMAGKELQLEGDSLLAVFASAEDAAAAAVAIQRDFAAESWPEGGEVRVRIGLHTGEARRIDATTGGSEVLRAERIARCGHGGQILMSETTATLNERHLPPKTLLRDHGTHELKDLAYPERIHQLVVEGLPDDFPPLRTMSARKSNLPKGPALVGRDEEVSGVVTAVGQHRLVTLAGPAGVGKSRLAIAAAERLSGSFPDGVWLVDVSRVGDESLLASAVAKQLNVAESGPVDVIELVLRRLSRASTLLLLDGCEHIVDVVARFVERVMTATAHVQVMATSRQSLSAEREHLVRVAPLSVPPEDAVTAADIAQSASVALFVDRARTVQPNFDLNDTNAAFVAEICRHLDGLPLAIELAAGQLSESSVREIADRLERRLALDDGTRDGGRLETTLDWSYDSLSRDERTLFGRLSVFAGGFGAEAAVAVCADEALAADDVGPALDRLVDTSLVLASRDRPVRYRLLEPIGRYARHRLAHSAGLDEVQRRHAAYYLELAETADPLLRGPEQTRWAEALETERYNLRSALRWSRVHDTETALRLAGALRWFWVIQRDVTEGAAWLRSALADRGRASPAVVARAVNGVGLLAFRALDLTTARRAITETLTLYEQLGDDKRIARQTYHLGVLCWFEDNDASAIEHLERAESLLRRSADRWYLAWTLAILGTIARTSDDIDRAEALLAESHAELTEVGGAIDVGWSHLRLAALARDRGDYDQAKVSYSDGRVLLAEYGDEIGVAHADAGLGAMAWLEGSQTQALALFENALRAFGSSDEAAHNLFELKMMIQGNPSVAELQQVAQWNKERAGFEEHLGVKAALGEYLYHVGLTALRHDERARARTALRESLTLARDARDYRGVAVALIGLGRVLAADEDHAGALTMYAAAANTAEADGLDPWPPVSQESFFEEVAASRRALGAEADEVWTRGLGLSLNDVVATARSLASATPAQG